MKKNMAIVAHFLWKGETRVTCMSCSDGQPDHGRSDFVDRDNRLQSAG